MSKRCWNGNCDHSEIHGEQTRCKLNSWKLVHHFHFGCDFKRIPYNEKKLDYCKRKQVLHREFAATVVGYRSECQINAHCHNRLGNM